METSVKDIIEDKSLNLTDKELSLIKIMNNLLKDYFGEDYSDVDCKDIAEYVKWDIKTVKGVVGSLVKKKILKTSDTGTGYEVVSFEKQSQMEFYEIAEEGREVIVANFGYYYPADINDFVTKRLCECYDDEGFPNDCEKIGCYSLDNPNSFAKLNCSEFFRDKTDVTDSDIEEWRRKNEIHPESKIWNVFKDGRFISYDLSDLKKARAATREEADLFWKELPQPPKFDDDYEGNGAIQIKTAHFLYYFYKRPCPWSFYAHKRLLPPEQSIENNKSMKTNVKNISKKINAMYHCAGENLYPDGLLYQEGKIIATTGFILCVLKADYDSEKEGKIISKKGEILNSRFPNWKAVIPSDYHDYLIDVNSQQLFEAVKKIRKIKGLLSGKAIDSIIEVNGQFYNSNFIYKALSVDSDVKLYAHRIGLIGENEDYFFITTKMKIEPEEKDEENEKSFRWEFVKKIYTIDEAVNFVPYGKINFVDEGANKFGDKIKEVETNGYKIDIVHFDNKIHAVYQNISRAYVYDTYSIDELIDRFKEIVKGDDKQKINTPNKDSKVEIDNSVRSENKSLVSAHKVGDVHPRHPEWVWKEYKPGKFDWRINPIYKAKQK